MNNLELNGVRVEREKLLAAADILANIPAHRGVAQFLYVLERAALIARPAQPGTRTLEIGVDR